MPREPIGGLAGKARRNHRRNRAARSFQDQMVEEFFEPMGETSRRREIPIRRRGEFLPSAYFAAQSLSGGLATQLELPLDLAGEPDAPLRRRVVWPPEEVRRSRRQGRSGRCDRGAGRTSESRREVDVLNSASSRRASAVPPSPRFVRLTHTPGRRSKPPLTLGGFALGCALGGALAASILLALHVALG